MIACLKAQPAESILKKAGFISGYGADVGQEHKGAFLTDTPMNYLKAGRQTKNGVKWTEDIIKRLNPEETDPVALSIAKIYADWNFLYGIAESVQLQAKQVPVYCYLYKYKLNLGFWARCGTVHCLSQHVPISGDDGDDVLLIHSTPAHAADDFKYSDDEAKMTEYLLGMYDTRFYRSRPWKFSRVPKFGDTQLTRTVDKLEYTSIEGPDRAIVARTEPLCNMELWTEVRPELRL